MPPVLPSAACLWLMCRCNSKTKKVTPTFVNVAFSLYIEENIFFASNTWLKKLQSCRIIDVTDKVSCSKASVFPVKALQFSRTVEPLLRYLRN